ncbi:MAG TPA: hypothetical protein VF529_05365 [Solirubrobacteraceae bacterium]
MQTIARGWRRFRRLPGILQAAAWLALVAAYSSVLVLVLGGGGDDGRGPTRAAKRPLTPLEREVFDALRGVEAGRPVGEPTDVARFRAAVFRRVVCRKTACVVDYTVGVPGRGRLLEDQRPMIERVFRRTDVLRVTFNVVRDMSAAGVPPKRGEEAANGRPLLTTVCDRSDAPDVDWSSARGAAILQNLCDVSAYDPSGRPSEQEPVAPDDPAAQDLELPEGSGG